MPRDDLSGWGSEDRRESDLPVERRLDRLGWRVDSLDRWRRDVDHRLGASEDAIDGLKTADEIARAVADELSKPLEPGQRRPQVDVGGSIGWPQKLGALIVGGLVVADSLRGLFGL